MEQHPQPHSQTVVPAPPAPAGVPGSAPANPLATPGMVLGIVGLSVSWIPFLGIFSLPLGVLATVFGAIAVSKANKLGGLKKGHAVTAIVCGAVTLAIWFLFFLIFSAAISGLT
ncbi:MAG: hypothetical protein ACRDKW_16595 [Actinomycetota bacterium]